MMDGVFPMFFLGKQAAQCTTAQRSKAKHYPASYDMPGAAKVG